MYLVIADIQIKLIELKFNNAIKKFDPVNYKRDEYEKKLKKYYKNHKPRMFLNNKFCEANLITENGNVSYFLVKNKDGYMSESTYFKVMGNIEHVATMWAIFDFEFKKNTKYADLISLYKELNNDLDNELNDEYRYLHEYYTEYEYITENLNNKQNIQQNKIQNIQQNIDTEPIVKPSDEQNPKDKSDERNIDL